MSLFYFHYISLLATILIVCLTASHAMPYANSPRQNGNQNRHFVQFGNMIMSGMSNPFGYNGYGCWCGKGNRGDLVVDETDRCCQIHDRCWEAVQANHGCDPFWKFYDYEILSNRTIECTDRTDTCDYHSCQCDKVAVECFARQRTASYDPDFDDWKGLCNTTPNTPETDPQRCPSVWDMRAQYSNGSVVSIHGIVYQALYASGAGQNPLNHLHTSHYLGVVPTWKALGPCRRVNRMS